MEILVWTVNGMAFERIELDRYFHENIMDSVEHFFTYIPKIMGKWYTRKAVADVDRVVWIPESIEIVLTA